jgi:hypothetical protein
MIRSSRVVLTAAEVDGLDGEALDLLIAERAFGSVLALNVCYIMIRLKDGRFLVAATADVGLCFDERDAERESEDGNEMCHL